MRVMVLLLALQSASGAGADEMQFLKLLRLPGSLLVYGGASADPRSYDISRAASPPRIADDITTMCSLAAGVGQCVIAFSDVPHSAFTQPFSSERPQGGIQRTFADL
jgi:hypothetical protein